VRPTVNFAALEQVLVVTTPVAARDAAGEAPGAHE